MGAYSELDLDQRYEDDPFAEDDDTCALSASDGGCAPQGEPEPAPAAPQQPQTVEAQTAAPAQSGDGKADKDAKREAHEEAEAKRKAEWEARQQQKKDAEKLALAKLDGMSDDEVLAASLKRVGDDTEKLTRRQMMECVMEHIQTLCLADPAFARKVMHPKKTMIHCAQYINRKAWEYVQDELKARGVTPSRTEPYASAIPEGICYQWAEDYFNDPDAKEDHEEEEKFVPQPYRSTTAAASKKSTAKGSKGKAASSSKSKGGKDPAPKEAKPAGPKKQDDSGQISFGGFAMPEEKAG